MCRLRKSLYSLKQARKQLYEKFGSSLGQNGLAVNLSNSCVYSKRIGLDCVLICLYVDDMLILGTNLLVVNKTNKLLFSFFEMKDMGEADVILGIKIRKTNTSFSLCQSHYIEKRLKKFNHFDVTPIRTSYDPSIHLRKNKGPSVSQTEYAKIIGSVMFLINFTRSDIAYVVSRLTLYS